MAEMRDLKADLAGLTGDWGVHENDWFRANGVEIAEHAIERAMRAEELACELVGMLDRCIKLEANMLDDQHTTEQLYDEWVELQVLRNKVLAKAKEVLGDGN